MVMQNACIHCSLLPIPTISYISDSEYRFKRKFLTYTLYSWVQVYRFKASLYQTEYPVFAALTICEGKVCEEFPGLSGDGSALVAGVSRDRLHMFKGQIGLVVCVHMLSIIPQ